MGRGKRHSAVATCCICVDKERLRTVMCVDGLRFNSRQGIKRHSFCRMAGSIAHAIAFFQITAVLTSHRRHHLDLGSS